MQLNYRKILLKKLFLFTMIILRNYMALNMNFK